jgi:uncharacterized protein YndB with AHSA1/START domain
MKTIAGFQIDPTLDLVLERSTEIAPEKVWAAWTQPQHIRHWFTPAPWKTVDCKIDLRPGGMFYTLMQSPEGKDFPNHGCCLEVVPNRRLVFTDALQAGFRPTANPFFTGAVILEPQGRGTRYTAIAIHKDTASMQQHMAMGFSDGWGKAFDQLVAYMQTVG